MRQILIAGASLLTLLGCAASTGPVAVTQPAQQAAPAVPANPLLADWTGPYGGVPPWDQVKPELFPGAFEAGIAEQRREIDAIVNNEAPASFENTVVALERAGQTLDRVGSLYGVMTSNMSTPAYEALDREWSPKLTAVSDEITFNKKLFARIAAVYEGRAGAGLSAQQLRLTERVYDGFVRAGAKLDETQSAEVARLNRELATLFADFRSKLLADENTWTVVDNAAELAGMPESYIASAQAAAAERQLPGKWIIVNTRSSVDPILSFASNRALREKVWRKFVNRGDNGDANDTNAIIANIVKLRAERAHVLGFAAHANRRMDDTMAKDPARAMDLMMRVWTPAVARVREEVRDMQAIASRERPRVTIEPWDYLFYAEKVRKARYNLDQAELKPYFELNNMINASFYMAGRLYGLEFKEITGTVPVFEPSVRVWEVTDRASGRNVGLFYGDYFARAGKRSGAWMTTYRSQSTFDGPETTLASNNNNFTRGAPGEPVLISLDDAETLFHEFGHAIHYLLQNVEYPTLGGVPRDFVEYPSQVHEHWVLTRDVLDRFARHYQTGASMPQALVDRVKRSEKFNQGYATVSYLSSAIVDMKLHTMADGVVDPDAFERQTLADLGMPREIVMRHRLPQFGHLFSSDAYSAGYYSYLWSEVMDADTWKAFEETGDVWSPAVAAKMREHILSNGNIIDRADAYRAFRGRDPDVNALLEVRGFPTTPTPRRR
ncbi:MAG: peptidyl-dipeptidase Dcp [Caulobacteraceae bacterium]|nr:MAG: peptidyl-dipeptidase Dcp [Caulobacteraceae bacterium]